MLDEAPPRIVAPTLTVPTPVTPYPEPATVGGIFRLDSINRVDADQDTISACDPKCISSEQVLVHHRAVGRPQNVVVVLYFFGAKNAALQDANQVSE